MSRSFSITHSNLCSTAPAISADGKVIFTSLTHDDARRQLTFTLTVVSEEDGSSIWEYSYQKQGVVTGIDISADYTPCPKTPVLTGDNCVIVLVPGWFMASIFIRTSEVRWWVDLDSTSTVMTHTTELFIEPVLGNIMFGSWRVINFIHGAGDESSLYSNATLNCFDKDDGSIVWEKSFSDRGVGPDVPSEMGKSHHLGPFLFFLLLLVQ